MANDNKSPVIAQQLKVVGMVKDTSPSGINPPDSMFKSNPEFAYDIKNMRFIPINGPDLFDIVNEKGTLKLNITDITISKYPDQKIPNTDYLEIKGTPIGINIMNNELILFTTENVNVDTDDTTDNIFFQINTITPQLLDDNSTFIVNYDFIPNTSIDSSLIEEITIELKINLFSTTDYSITPIIRTLVLSSLKSYIDIDLTNEKFDFLTIDSFNVFYKKDTVDEKVLLTTYLLNNLTSDKKSFPIYAIQNVLFPNYTLKTQSIEDSIPVEYIPNTSIYPNLIVINGKITQYPTEEDSTYKFIPNDNYNTDFKWFYFDKTTDTWELSNDVFPEVMPDVDGILVLYYDDTNVINIPFYFECVATTILTQIDNRDAIVYTNTGSGSLVPELSDIKNITEIGRITKFSLEFETEKTFNTLEVTINGKSDVLTSINNKYFETLTSNLLFGKEGEYTIIIKSL